MPPKRTSAPPPAIAGGTAKAATSSMPSADHSTSRSHTPGETQPRRPTVTRGLNPLLNATSWGYQLQNLNLKRAAESPFDVLVVDYARDGSDKTALKPKDIERIRQKPNGGSRLILAYLSVGEAESYRYYWDATWTLNKPAWLLSENPEWRENYSVCFWDPGWQRLMCGSPTAYLDKMLAAGFDGVYLDKCDVFEDLERRDRKAAKTRPDIEGDMVAFISQLSRYAKSKAPGFLMVMQNTENLLEHEGVMAAIDGVAKEELLFGLSGPERKNSKSEVQEARSALDSAKSAGKAVLVVEYLDTPAKIAEAADYMQTAGYVLYIAPKDRELDRLNFDVFEA